MSARAADVRDMFERIADRYDRANRIMSAGIDRLWRGQAVRRLLDGLEAAPCILDLGAGTLDGAVAIQRRRPAGSVLAADFSRNMLVAGRDKPGARAVAAQVADAHALPYRDGVFAGAFSAFCVRNLRDPALAMRELRRVVRPGGRVVILEFFRPPKRRLFWDGIYNAHVLPLVGRAVSGDGVAYRYLPESIQQFSSRQEFAALLQAAGFAVVSGRELFPGGVAALVVAE